MAMVKASSTNTNLDLEMAYERFVVSSGEWEERARRALPLFSDGLRRIMGRKPHAFGWLDTHEVDRVYFDRDNVGFVSGEVTALMPVKALWDTIGALAEIEAEYKDSRVVQARLDRRLQGTIERVVKGQTS